MERYVIKRESDGRYNMLLFSRGWADDLQVAHIFTYKPKLEQGEILIRVYLTEEQPK